MKYVPQVFFIRTESDLRALDVKIVDNILFCGGREFIENIIGRMQASYKLRTVLYGPATFLYYGLRISQDADYTSTIHADEKLQSYEAFPVDRNRRKMQDEALNVIELKSFRYLKSSVGWLGITVSPI